MLFLFLCVFSLMAGFAALYPPYGLINEYRRVDRAERNPPIWPVASSSIWLNSTDQRVISIGRCDFHIGKTGLFQ